MEMEDSSEERNQTCQHLFQVLKLNITPISPLNACCTSNSTKHDINLDYVMSYNSRRAEENCKATFLSHQKPPDYLGHTSNPLGKLPQHFHNFPSGTELQLYAHSPLEKLDPVQHISVHPQDLEGKLPDRCGIELCC